MCRATAVLIELVARLTQPPFTPISPSDDHLGGKHELHTLRLRINRLGVRVLPACTLARELLLGLTQRSTSPLTRPQMLRQLIATCLAVERSEERRVGKECRSRW